jgi:hypothetical protein
MLRVNHDALAIGQILEVDSMAASSEAQLDPVVDESFGLHPLGHAHLGEQVDCLLLEDAGTDALLNILAAAVLDYDGIDSIEIEQVREHQSRGPCPNDPDLRALWIRHWNEYRKNCFLV